MWNHISINDIRKHFMICIWSLSGSLALDSAPSSTSCDGTYPSCSAYNVVVSEENFVVACNSYGTSFSGRSASLDEEINIFEKRGLFSLSHSKALYTRILLTLNMSGKPLSGRFFGPTKVIPIVAVRTFACCGMIDPSTIHAI